MPPLENMEYVVYTTLLDNYVMLQINATLLLH